MERWRDVVGEENDAQKRRSGSGNGDNGASDS